MPSDIVVLHSALAPETLADSLAGAIDKEFTPRAAMPWFVRMLWKGTSREVCGVVDGKTFRLKKRDSSLCAPNFYGKWQSEPGGTRIEGHFDLAPSAVWSLRITLVVTVGLAIIGIVLNTLDLKAGTHFTTDPAVGLWISALFIPFVIAVYYVAHVIGSRREKQLLAFLEHTLAATLVR